MRTKERHQNDCEEPTEKRQIYGNKPLEMKIFVRSKHSPLFVSTDIQNESWEKRREMDKNFDAQKFYHDLVNESNHNQLKNHENTNSANAPVPNTYISHFFDTLYEGRQQIDSPFQTRITYGIAPSNKGYQILNKSMKWEPQNPKGLHPERSGILYPIASQFKLNKAGLGSQDFRKQPKRITHTHEHIKQEIDRIQKQDKMRKNLPKKSEIIQKEKLKRENTKQLRQFLND
jgi:hypothetical protein